MRKPTICLGENKDADSFAVTAPLISLLDQGRPSSAFEKWPGHETSKTFYECRRHRGEHSTRGDIPPLVSVCVWGGGGGSGDLSEKMVYFLIL